MEDLLKQILETLQDIRDNPTPDEYEMTSVFTIGGASGQYLVRSPYNTESEFSIIGALAQGANSAGVIYVSSDNPGISNLTSTPGNYGTSPVNGGSQGMDNNAFDGYVLPITVTGNVPLNDYWQALGRGVNIYANIQMSSGNGYLLVAFRRKLIKDIPNAPRAKPHTHSHVQSRGQMRKLAAMSDFTSGFESRYPTPVGQPYQHEIVPVSQDTTVTGNRHSATVNGQDSQPAQRITGYRAYRKQQQH